MYGWQWQAHDDDRQLMLHIKMSYLAHCQLNWADHFLKWTGLFKTGSHFQNRPKYCINQAIIYTRSVHAHSWISLHTMHNTKTWWVANTIQITNSIVITTQSVTLTAYRKINKMTAIPTIGGNLTVQSMRKWVIYICCKPISWTISTLNSWDSGSTNLSQPTIKLVR